MYTYPKVVEELIKRIGKNIGKNIGNNFDIITITTLL